MLDKMTNADFGTEITDKEKRIRARQDRIRQKIEPEKSKEGSSQESNIVEGFQRLNSEQQVADSLSLLDSQKADGILNLTQVRVNADHKENERRIKEEKRRHCRLQLLEKDDTSSTSKCENIVKGWDDVAKARTAQELHQLINDQKARCAYLLAEKDDVVKEFRHELKQKDEEYIISLKDQTNEIDELQKVMKEEYQNMQNAYSVEAEAIEEAFVQDRQNLIEANKKELNDLFEKVSSTEEMQIQMEQRRRDLNKEEIGAARMKGLEEYKALKAKLESDVQKLECQLEDTHAMYQLNSDSLEYNLRILSEKDVENEALIKKQKKRLLKSKEDLNRTTEKEIEQGFQNQRKNASLEEDCLRIEKQCSGLQSKFQRFLNAYKQKYMAVLTMHKEEITELVQRAKNAENIINHQILGEVRGEVESEGKRYLDAEGQVGQTRTKSKVENIPNICADPQDIDEGVLIKISDIITDDIFDLWQQLEKLMINYNKILEERAKGVVCVNNLLHDNSQLQAELNENLQDKINEELIIPPSSCMVAE